MKPTIIIAIAVPYTLRFALAEKFSRMVNLTEKGRYTHTIKISIEQSGCFGDCYFKAVHTIYFLKKSKHELI